MTGFDECLPARLGRRGYDTWALHGNGGEFYSRKTFYPLLGFRHAEFYDDFKRRSDRNPQCSGTVFQGICDEQVYQRALNLFDGTRRFVHVMTLDTHLPVRSAQFPSCSASFKDDAGLCGYDRLVERSMRQLGEALRRAKSKPDLIFIYGDHAPPFAGQAARDVFHPDRIPFLRLRRIW